MIVRRLARTEASVAVAALMKPVRNVKLMGRTWRLRYVPKLSGRWGDCDDPAEKHRTIRISREARGLKELEVLIHELSHGCNWVQASEEFITQSARDIARVLWRLGYRKITNGTYEDDAGVDEDFE